MQPGWYDDPFARGWLRWWDGTSWSSHQAPVGSPPGQPVLYGMFTPTPTGDLANEEKWARWAGWAFIAIAVVGIAGYVIAEPLGGHWLRHVWDKCTAQLDNGATRCDSFSGQGRVWEINLISLPTLAPQIVMMIWLMNAARIGRRLGLPARRDPAWAFGFFVPVVNFWFPYQVAVDSIPPGDQRRSTVGWWWAFYLVQSVAVVPILLVGIFSVGAAVILGVIASVLPVLAALRGRRMVREILAVHRELLATAT